MSTFLTARRRGGAFRVGGRRVAETLAAPITYEETAGGIVLAAANRQAQELALRDRFAAVLLAETDIPLLIS